MSLSDNFVEIAEGVWQPHTNRACVSSADIVALKNLARQTNKQRARICLHRSQNAAIHEMLIVLSKDTYVRPHRHVAKSESIFVVEGQARLLLFDTEGRISANEPLSTTKPDAIICHRMDDKQYHTILVEDEFFVFKEVTTGPFRLEDTEYAPWAPQEGSEAAAAYLTRLRTSSPTNF